MYCKVIAVLAVAAFASANDIHEGYNGTASQKPAFQGHYAGDWKSAVRPGIDIFVNTTGLITAINVTDLRDGKDGVASIASGGVGHDNVTISLKSPNILRGYDFLVEVFDDEETSKTNERGNRDVQESATPRICHYPAEQIQRDSRDVQQTVTAKPIICHYPKPVQTSTTGKPTDQQQQHGTTSKTGKPNEQQQATAPTGQQQHQVPTGKPTGQQEQVTTGTPEQEQHQHGTGKPTQQQAGHPTTAKPKQEVEIPQEVQEQTGFQIEQQH
ncbi:mediator of RNA polymerase II transcription subunit 15-like [Leguminivora glycinivorella]|uniref:mediator of RNA polymerase II transcription subunit 15-like n=1 Tax=Leguminivora glycinivorella TaxID=1035111 RepID=UPI00200F545A|nr:mediator of RNA polymerase II transcription subunit 15-like [Leguminivora glycinivorella]